MTSIVKKSSSLKNWIYFFIKIKYFVFIDFFCFTVEKFAKFHRFLNRILSFELQLSYLISFILFWTISIKMSRLIIFKTTIILFILNFDMRALVLRLRVKIIIWFFILFNFIEMTNFVRLIISVKLIIEEFVTFMLIITADVAFAHAIQNNFLSNDFKQYNFFNIWHIFHNKELVFQYWDKFN